MKQFLLIIFAFGLVACQKENALADYEGNTIEISFANLKNGTEIFLFDYPENEKATPKDTATIKNKKAVFKLPETKENQTELLYITSGGGEEMLPLINENHTVKITFYNDSVNASSLNAGKETKLLNEYLHEINKNERKFHETVSSYPEADLETDKVENQIRIEQVSLKNKNKVFRKKFINENPNAPASLIAYVDLINGQNISVPEMKSLYANLGKESKETALGKKLSQRYKQSDPLAIGNKPPSFSAKTPDGKKLALEDALGETYTLVDFWAAWCGPCRKENPNLVKVYNKYKDKGFAVLGVSLDRNKKSWLEAIEKDGLEWNQISNLKFWQDPIAKQYRITSIPANFLLDSEGKIVAKNLRGKGLKTKLNRLYKENY